MLRVLNFSVIGSPAQGFSPVQAVVAIPSWATYVLTRGLIGSVSVILMPFLATM